MFNDEPLRASRAEGLSRLEAFLPHAGATYRNYRNYLSHPEGLPTVSALSPWLRHRLITEEEVIAAVINAHGTQAAEKYIQEVLWRVYWKGFLEQRPALWHEYRNTEIPASDLTTNIKCMDDWQKTLETTGYLHNHVRMWFASIWQFTLHRSWHSGADFFLRHLLDGDPASNTLSWRWVGGLQTNGKIYLATADNISRHTAGQYSPQKLARSAEPPPPPVMPARIPLPAPFHQVIPVNACLLIHEEDLHPESLFEQRAWADVIAIQTTLWRSSLPVSTVVTDFVHAALKDAISRNATPKCRDANMVQATPTEFANLSVRLNEQGITQVVTPWAPCGPTADALSALESELNLRAIELIRVPRNWDLQLWPRATHGFFRFWKNLDLTDL